MARRRKAFPQLPAKIDPQTRQYLSALQEMVETGEGARGDPLDTKLTFRDLIDAGIARLKGQINPGGITGDQLEPGGVPDMATPPAPQGAEFIAVFDAVTCIWSDPYAAYSNHAHTEVWRAQGVSAPFDTAEMIGISDGSMYSDYAVEGGTDYTYWIRFVSTSNVRGPWHNPSGTHVQAMVSVKRMIEELSAEIDESHLSAVFSTGIPPISETYGDWLDSIDQRIEAIKTRISERIAAINDRVELAKSNIRDRFEAIAGRVPNDTEIGVLLTISGVQDQASQLLNETGQVSAQIGITIAQDIINYSISDSSALAQKISTLSVNIGDNAAAITDEQEARITSESAIAKVLTALTGSFNGNIANIISDQSVEITEDSAIGTALSVISADVEDNAAAIISESAARANADSALSSSLNALISRVGSAESAIISEASTRASKDSVLAKSITTLQTSLNGSIASIETKAQTAINKADGVSAEYTLKLDVNGYVSGFGTYNDGKTSDFAVSADRFWIAPPGSTGKIKPFIVVGGSVYIDSAYIRDASIQEGKLGPISFGKIKDSSGQPVTTLSGKLKAQNIDVDSLQVTNANISGDLWSTNYNPGVAGWKIWRNGDAEFNNATVRGTLSANDIVGALNITQPINVSGTNWVSPGTVGNMTYITSLSVNLYGRDDGYVPFFMLNFRMDSRTGTNSDAGTERSGIVMRVQIWNGGTYLGQFDGGCLAEGLAGGISISGSGSGRVTGTITFKIYGGSYQSYANIFQATGLIGGLA